MRRETNNALRPDDSDFLVAHGSSPSEAVELSEHERFRALDRATREKVLAEHAAQSGDLPARRALFALAASRDARVQAELKALLASARFPLFDAAVRAAAYRELARHPANSAARETLCELIETAGFAGLAADEQARLLCYAGGTNAHLSQPARRALRKLIGSASFRAVAAVVQAIRLRAFLTAQSSAPEAVDAGDARVHGVAGEGWQAAIDADGFSASQRARSSAEADFAESVLLYQRVRGTPEEAELRAIMPARFALIDALSLTR